MGKENTKLDAYIAKSAPFARPILNHLRELVHKACPEVEEDIKWGFPHFLHHGILCSMAAFRQHCALGFWKGSIMSDPHKVMQKIGRTAMGQFDRITSLAGLPPDKVLIAYIREAMKLNEEDIKVPKKPIAKADKKIRVPPFFLKELKKSKTALKVFESFSFSNKKDYVEWITEAKTAATREKRVATAVEWISEGKIRNWKYVK